MKTILIMAMCLLSFSLMAQTRGFDLDDYRTIWYDSLYSAQKSKTTDLAMKYPSLSIIFVNKSATITDTVKLFSVTKGYKKTIPHNAVDFSVSAIWLKNSAGESIASDGLITIAPSSAKEYVIVNFAVQLIETILLNTNADAKAYYYIKGVKEFLDKK